MNCKVCGCRDTEKPMCFKGLPYCSDTCQKVYENKQEKK